MNTNYSTYYTYIQNCIAANISLSSSSNYGRIVGDTWRSNIQSNKSLTTTKIYVNGEETTASNDARNGTGIGSAMLKKVSTYTDLDWNFENVWTIDENESLPFPRCFLSNETQKISVMPLTIRQGKNATLVINFDNEDTMIAFEFYLQLPEGVSIVLDEDGYPDVLLNNERSNRHTLEATQEGNGQYHFLCYSNRNYALKDNKGELLRMNLICDNDIETGTYHGLIHTINFSNQAGNRVILSHNKIDIEVSDVFIGDVNGDDEIDVMDIVMMVNHIMGNNPSNFILAAADHDGNGSVDVMDLVKEVQMIMYNSEANASDCSFDELSGALSLKLDKEGAISVNIADDSRFVASQFVVKLTEGQQLVDVTSDRHHTVSFHPIAKNQYVVVCYSPNNKAFGTNGKALTLHVIGEGQVSVENATFVSADEKKVRFQNVSPEYIDGILYPVIHLNMPTDIYSVSGQLMKKNATSTENMKSGVYVVNDKKHIVK